jgi:hypothetical protein
VLHRDLSLGNILLVRDHTGRKYINKARMMFPLLVFKTREAQTGRPGGLLHDLDMAGIVTPVSSTQTLDEMMDAQAKPRNKRINFRTVRQILPSSQCHYCRF